MITQMLFVRIARWNSECTLGCQSVATHSKIFSLKESRLLAKEHGFKTFNLKLKGIKPHLSLRKHCC